MYETLDYCFVETVSVCGGFTLVGSILDESGFEDIPENGDPDA